MESRKYGTAEPICKEGIETQAWRTHLWTQQGKERVGPIEKASLTQRHIGKLPYNTGSVDWHFVMI